MPDNEFDAALVAAAFTLAGETGWIKVNAAAAARRAGLDLGVARARFSHAGKILRKFGELADAHALEHALGEGVVRDRLFDTLMRRFDFLQAHRAGVLALLKSLPFNPPLALYLAEANITSMGWLLEAAGVAASGPLGSARKHGLLAIWAYGLRAWMRDESPDLTATMAAVDTALNRADSLASRFMPEAKTAMPEEPPFTPPPGPDLPFPATPTGVA